MVTLERITVENAAVYRAIRLQALLDSPLAFCSTHAGESRLSDADWKQRVAEMDGESAVGFLALDAGEPCGLVRGYLDETDPRIAFLVSMWVAPSHRRSGVGAALVEAIQHWAAGRRAHQLRLTVISGNAPAIAFYQRLGFTMTGKTDPYPNDPALTQYEMARLLEPLRSIP